MAPVSRTPSSYTFTRLPAATKKKSHKQSRTAQKAAITFHLGAGCRSSAVPLPKARLGTSLIVAMEHLGATECFRPRPFCTSEKIKQRNVPHAARTNRDPRTYQREPRL